MITATTTLTIDGTEQTFTHDARVTLTVNNDAAWTTCGCCGRSDYARRFNDPKAHKSFCDLRGMMTVQSAEEAERAAAKVSRATFLRAAREGAISAVATETEIRDAVRAGVISESDAMNRDF